MIFHYRTFERGQCIDNRQSTFDTDSRRIAYEKSKQLFALIGEPFEQININKINEILARFPYDDSPSRALDIVEDFEELSLRLKEDNTLNSTIHKNLDYFVEKPYRDHNGGIADFENEGV